MACGRIKTENINNSHCQTRVMTMRNQIKNAVAEFFLFNRYPRYWKTPQRMIVQALREGRRMTMMRSQKGKTQERVADTLRKHRHAEEVPNGNRKCCNRWIVFMGCENQFVFLCLSGKKENGQREKRKNKVPKHEKKSKEKVAKIKKGWYGWDEGELRL